MYKYYLTEKRGRKRYPIAATNSGDCISGAGDIFRLRGYTTTGRDVSWGIISTCKNFVDGPCPVVEATEDERKAFWYRDTFASGLWESREDFLETFPDAALYI